MTRRFELRGVHVLAMLLVFFGAVMAVNFYFVAKALDTFPGEDEDHSYAQGLHYNDTLRDRAQQARLGWRADADLRPDGASGVVLEVRVLDRAGAALSGLHLSGALRRPADAKFDQQLDFQPQSGGYVAHLKNLPEGHWTLRVRATGDDDHFDLGKDFVWRRLRS